MSTFWLAAACIAVCVLALLGLILLHHFPDSRLSRFADQEIDS